MVGYFGDAAYNMVRVVPLSTRACERYRLIFTYYQPLDWAQRQGNITYFSKKTPDVPGGHFPAHVNPQGLVEDCWAFWGNRSLSGIEAIP